MIRFPQKHIADSVAERIMAAQQQAAQQQEMVFQENSVAVQGAKLDKALAQPVGDVAAIEGIEEAIAARAMDI